MNIEVGEVKYRWMILLLYSLALGSNAMMWISISPILTVVSKVIDMQTYHVDDIWIEMCSLSYMIMFIPFVFPANFVLDILGLRTGVIDMKILTGIIITTIGAWVRIGAEDSFWFILLGNTLAAIGQPFLLNPTAKIAATWFRPEMVFSP